MDVRMSFFLGLDCMLCLRTASGFLVCRFVKFLLTLEVMFVCMYVVGIVRVRRFI